MTLKELKHELRGLNLLAVRYRAEITGTQAALDEIEEQMAKLEQVIARRAQFEAKAACHWPKCTCGIEHECVPELLID